MAYSCVVQLLGYSIRLLGCAYTFYGMIFKDYLPVLTFLQYCGAEKRLVNVVIQLLWCFKWLLGRGYEVFMSLIIGCLIGRVK